MDANPGLFQGLIAALVLGGIGHVCLTCAGFPRFALRLFATSLVLRFGLSIAIYQLGLINVLKDEDGSGWIAGSFIAQNWHDRNLGLFDVIGEIVRTVGGRSDHSYTGYFNLLGFFFYFVDAPFRLVAAALNCFFGALTPVMVYAFGRILFTEKVGRLAGWWTCLIPSMIVWSSMTIKEPAVICLETIAIYACVHLRKRGFSPGHFATCVACIILLLGFRFYASYVVGLCLLLTLFLPDFNERGTIGRAFLGAMAGLLLFASGWMDHAEQRLESMSLSHFQVVRAYGATTQFGSGVETEDIRSQSGFFIGLSVGAAHLLLAPFPWQLGGGSLRMLLTVPELLVWWWLFFYGVVPGTFWVMRHRLFDCLPLLLFLFAFGVLYSLSFGNVGLVFRQRAQLLPWLLVLAMVGLEVRRQRAGKRGPIDRSTPPLKLSSYPLQSQGLPSV